MRRIYMLVTLKGLRLTLHDGNNYDTDAKICFLGS